MTITKLECKKKEIKLEIEHNACYKNSTTYYRFVIEGDKPYVHKIDLDPFIEIFQFAICDSVSENFEEIINTYEKISLTDYEKHFDTNVLCHKPLITGILNSPD